MFHRPKAKGVINGLHRLAEGVKRKFLNYKHLRVKSGVFLTGYIVAMANYYAMRIVRFNLTEPKMDFTGPEST